MAGAAGPDDGAMPPSVGLKQPSRVFGVRAVDRPQGPIAPAQQSLHVLGLNVAVRWRYESLSVPGREDEPTAS